VVRGRLTEEERDAALARVTGTTRLEDLADVDFVIEAIAEELDVKRAVFAALDEICKPGRSWPPPRPSLPVVECARGHNAALRRGRMHFFTATVMSLVEVVSTDHHGAGRRGHGARAVRAAGKVPVSCGDRARASSSTRCCSLT